MKHSDKKPLGGKELTLEESVEKLTDVSMQMLEGLPREERKRRLTAFHEAVNDAVASSRAKRSGRSGSAPELTRGRK